MTKDIGELLLDGLVYASEKAESNGDDEMAEFLAELYQVAGEVIFTGHDARITSPCAVSILQAMKDKDGRT